jgi:hypothetical protein
MGIHGIGMPTRVIACLKDSDIVFRMEQVGAVKPCNSPAYNGYAHCLPLVNAFPRDNSSLFADWIDQHLRILLDWCCRIRLSCGDETCTNRHVQRGCQTA